MQFPNYIISVKTSFVIRNIFLTYVQSKFQVLCHTVFWKNSISNFVNREGVCSFYPCKIRKWVTNFKGKTQFSENVKIHAAKFITITGIYVKEQLNIHFKLYHLYTITEEFEDSTC